MTLVVNYHVNRRGETLKSLLVKGLGCNLA